MLLAVAGVGLLLSTQAFVEPDHPFIQYTGRIGIQNPKAPTFHYGYSQFRTAFDGTSLGMEFEDDGWHVGSYLGIRIDDGIEIPLHLEPKKKAIYQVAVGLKRGKHRLQVYRRSDGVTGTYTFHGLYLDKGCKLLDPGPRPVRRIEFYGDSVTAGAVVEAVGYEAQSDDNIKTFNEDERLTNAYWSYAAIAGRKLGAEVVNCALGGLALNDKNGWWCGEDTIGLETTYDKMDPIKWHLKSWDFKRYTPQLMVIAIGQNDGRYMKPSDPAIQKKWVSDFNKLLDSLHRHYPHATFILTTTLLYHDLGWDTLLESIARNRKDRVLNYRYRRAGKGTPGHLRLAEHQEMADELVKFINKLPNVWE